MPKPRSEIAAAKEQRQAADLTESALIGRVFGKGQERMRNVSITLPVDLTNSLQDIAMKHKRAGDSDLTSVSAIIRDALEKAGY